jgi:hypothetical protein
MLDLCVPMTFRLRHRPSGWSTARCGATPIWTMRRRSYSGGWRSRSTSGCFSRRNPVQHIPGADGGEAEDGERQPQVRALAPAKTTIVPTAQRLVPAGHAQARPVAEIHTDRLKACWADARDAGGPFCGRRSSRRMAQSASETTESTPQNYRPRRHRGPRGSSTFCRGSVGASGSSARMGGTRRRGPRPWSPREWSEAQWTS